MKNVLPFFLFITHVAFAQKMPKTFTEQISPSVFALSKVMMHDVVNPPAASRYYAYCLLGAYEIVSQNGQAVPSLNHFIRDFKSVSIANKSSYNYQIAALYCILETGRLMLPSGYMLQEDEENLISGIQKQKIKKEIIDQSVYVANEVAKQIVAYSKSDHYRELSAKVRYRPIRDDAHWYPTPPTYIEAVEPNWKTIRPMIIDSCNQFIPKPPVAFSKDTTSSFYRLAKEVYDVSQKPTQEQLNKAAFWDCNPFAVSTSGHMSIGYKKISPGGHWMNIAGIAAEKAHLGFDKTILVHTVVSVTLMDAFISCWDEKYRSNRIRPETYINRYVNLRWQPLLQTPPFPEYPSGHSVISTASAEVLTYLLGNKFSFTDDSERMFDLPSRSFSSFYAAATEAAISRLYGGIHFRDAVENGQKEGAAVGAKVVSVIKKAGIKPLL